MEALQYFEEIASTFKNAEIDEWKREGGRVIGTVCSNIPEEILYAAQILPMRLRAPELQDTSNADSQLHRINCSYTRSVLELIMSGDVEFLDGLVTTNTCDHMLRLAGELADKSDAPFIFYFNMFHTLVDASREWFIMESKKLIEHIEEVFGVKISDDDLRRSISVYNRTRGLMAKLDEMRKNDPPPLSGAEYMNVALAGMSLPRELFNDRLEAMLPEIEGRPGGEAGQPRLMIMGGACDVPEFIDFIEAKGATVVADALCFGMRHYQGLIDENSEAPIEAIADRYMNRFACPSAFNAFDHNYAILKEIIDEWGINGIVSARLKFCDHWGGHKKMLADELQGKNLPLLDLEREYSTKGSGQISTRVQAFLEMLGS